MAELDRDPRSIEARDKHEQALREIDSRLLLGSHGRVLILHDGRRYELRETRFGKLILTR
ncbi:hemin uptake protein HemP [Wenzhouxiangella marina]|uniref:Uncharacterized protein n=1 Tax=Wenzhouxiangella marina TaxID=1579979 RepID=A0A0K0XXJ1_9GAMM|nr:hemin uptake protein HemP [Wenzhouxiangella marina]AKS42352.1 hypothetical protein WM2015_1986 [Wenzhouxiangella marina]MBB6085875.1 hemin uptake protein HemP [Wenzhouxiangella marina]